MNNTIVEDKKGIKLHFLNTEKFKTNIISVFLTTKLTRENVTKNALIPAVLRLGTNNIKTQKELNIKLDTMYGANFNCGIEKRGDNQVLKFYIEAINDEFVLEKENILEQSINLLLDVVFNPLVCEDSFKEDYVNGEKKNLKKIIESKIDDKSAYAYIRCIEEMYKNKSYGLYQYGYVEDLEKINAKNLYEYYKTLLQQCKIDIFISGKLENEERIKSIIEKNDQIKLLNERTPEFIHDSKDIVDNIEEKIVSESMNITQGKLVIGMNIKDSNEEEAPLSVYNAILGGGANSKLFQNVREKASLAYTASSLYLKNKNNIIIRCGIEIGNYEKAVEIIKQQLEDMKQGKFSDENITDAKELMIASLNSIKDEQTSQISYLMSQELLDKEQELSEYIEQIKLVTREQIIDVANKVKINTIYFLKD